MRFVACIMKCLLFVVVLVVVVVVVLLERERERVRGPTRKRERERGGEGLLSLSWFHLVLSFLFFSFLFFALLVTRIRILLCSSCSLFVSIGFSTSCIQNTKTNSCATSNSN